MTSEATAQRPYGSTDPVVRAATAVVGGPRGAYARVTPHTWGRTVAVLTGVATVTMTLGMFEKGHCVANGWSVPDVYWRACYSDLPFLFSGTPLSAGEFPYGTGTMSQPPLTGALLWLLALLVPGGDPVTRARTYFLLYGALAMILVALLVRVTAQSLPSRPWRALHVAAAPVLVTAALVSPDLFGVTLASYGLFFWARRRPEVAGVAFGLAIAARTYPVLLVAVLGLLAARAGRMREWSATAGTALLTFVGTLAALFGVGLATGAFGGPGDVGLLLSPYRTWLAGGADYGSMWYVFVGLGLHVTAAPALAALGWIAALAAGVVLVRRAPRRPRVAEVALVVVCVVLLTGRSLPVQTSLWLVPLVALAGLRWRDHLVWATGEMVYFVAIWLFLGGFSDANRGLPRPWLLVAILVRLAGIAWLAYAAWRQAVTRPPEAESGAADADELAGPLAGAPDVSGRLVLAR